MTPKTLKTALTTALATALLAACGGGGGGGSSANCDAATSSGCDGVALGTITGFGSVVVNGRHFETTDANIVIDGQTGRTQADLREGMLVSLTFNSSTRNDDRVSAVGQIVVDDSISGRISGGGAGASFLVMGQTVLIDDTTFQFEDRVRQPGGLNLGIGDFVRVQGQRDENGSLRATYVNRMAVPTAEFEVKGTISGHNTTTNEFFLDLLRVSYGAGTTLANLPSGNWNGLQVEAKGSCANTNRACGTLTATRLQREDSLPAGGGATALQVEIEGYATQGSFSAFKLNGIDVVATNARWEGGKPADFGVGVRLEAEGTLSGTTLTATKVSLRDAARLEGDIATVTNVSTLINKLTLVGLPGLSLVVDAQSATPVPFNPAPGQHIKVRGPAAGNDTVLAVRKLELSGSSGRLELRGRVSAASGNALTVLGKTVDVNGLSFKDSRGATETTMTQAAFLAAAKVGATVKLRSNNNGSSWAEAELEAD